MLLVRGVRESAKANNIMVAIKIGAILVFLVIGGALVNPANWHPFAPSGFGGVVTGGAIVFFTYIGFDSVSTDAEEARDPQKDLPFGIIASLIVCTILYVGVSIVLLGMMKYTTFVTGEAADAPDDLGPGGAGHGIPDQVHGPVSGRDVDPSPRVAQGAAVGSARIAGNVVSAGSSH